MKNSHQQQHIPLPALTVFLILTPVTTFAPILAFLHHLSKHKPRRSPPLTGKFFHSQPAGLPPTFLSVNALLTLPSPLSRTLLVSDVEANDLYYIHENLPSLTIPFMTNAGGATNATQAASLRRPGIAGMAVYDVMRTDVRILVARNTARDISMFTIAPQQGNDRLAPILRESVTVCNSFNGSRLNAPHSIHVDALGNIFFTDPTFGLMAATDEFDRQLDTPADMEQNTQNLYYIPAGDVRNAFESGVPALPRLLVQDLDRPTGIATVGNRLFVATASPRLPVLGQFTLQTDANGELETEGDMRVLYDWSSELHGWGQRWFSGVVGHLAVINERWIVVGAGDGLAVFDVSKEQNASETSQPSDWVSIDVPPGPPSAVMSARGMLYVAASDRIMQVQVNV